MTEVTDTQKELIVDSGKSLTRRQLLRAAAVSGVVLVGGSALAACGGSSNATIKVTFLTNGWPGDAMPTTAQQKASVATRAYADALANWQKQNPGVTIKHTDTSIWNQQTVTQSIAAGTAPTWYMTNVLGSFQNPLVRSALARGLASDITELVQNTHLESQLTSYFLPTFQKWKVNQKYYGTPGGYGIGDGMFFRRDLIKQAGLVEPTPGWTWTDFRKLAQQLQAANPKMKGAALQFYVFDQSLFANGLNSGATNYGQLGLTPAPSQGWPWKYDLTPWESQYEAVVNNWRGMYFVDKTLTSATSTGDSDVAQAFATGAVTMCANNTGFFTTPAVSSPTSSQNIALKLGKPFDEVVGWISHPIGYLGSFGATQAGPAFCSVDPHFQRNPLGLAKAYDFAVSMLVGQGMVDQTVEIYKANHDLKAVYQYLPPMSKNQQSFPGIPGTPEQAWGATTINSVNAAAAIPQLPDPAFYFPPETSAGPTGDAWNDANSGMAYTQDTISSVLAKLQGTQNAQFASLSSSISPSDFLASAKKFFADLDAFWAQHAPIFSAEAFHPWYEQTVLPALG